MTNWQNAQSESELKRQYVAMFGESDDYFALIAEKHRDQRMDEMRRAIERHRYFRRKKAEHARTLADASDKYRRLTAKWTAEGATWIDPGRYGKTTEWTYGGEVFFAWKSGVDFITHVKAAQEADERFEELRERERLDDV
jgi:hypothetical protein